MHKKFFYKAIVLLALIMVGCGRSPQPHFYILESQATETQDSISYATGSRIGIVVTIPSYLDRLPIVVRSSQGNILHIADVHQWGEPLSDGVARLLCDGIAPEIKGSLIFPMRSALPAEWRLAVDIARLDGTLNGEALLEVWWSLAPLSDGPTDTVTAAGRFVSRIQVGSDMQALANAESLLLDRLAKSLALEVNKYCTTKQKR